MVRLFALAALAAAPALAVKSSGCGKSTSLKPGTTNSMSGTYGGVKRTWLVYLPKNYDSSKAYPLIVSTHGWGGDGAEDEDDSGLSVTSGNLGSNGFIAVYPDGREDNNSRGGPWGSWNCVGSTQGSSSKGATCQNWADAKGSYCYNSCPCSQQSKPNCWWTTCANDISPTGVGKADSAAFIPQLYDLAEQSFCVDTAREYHTGMSNGAMFTFQAGVSMSSRLAAIAPIAGSFHYGFLQSPTEKVPLLSITGTQDTSVPANGTATKASDSSGYYWETFANIAKGWKVANGCSASTKIKGYAPDGVSKSLVSQYKLTCVDQGCDVISCAWNGAHLYFGGAGRYWGGGQDNGDLVWAFFDKFSKASHIGGGRVAGVTYNTTMPAHQIADVAVHADWTRPTELASPFERVEMAVEDRPAPSAHVHYKNPLKGNCLKDETMLEFSNGAETGFVCAPRKVKAEGSLGKPAAPPCVVGGMGPINNGCPGDRPAPSNGTKVAYPTCLSFPVADQDYHCMLTCDPCNVNDHECSREAHDMCPLGAKCMVGFLKNVRQGLCVYTDFDPSDDGVQ